MNRRSAVAAAGAFVLTLSAAGGAIAANTGLFGRASSVGPVGGLSPISVPETPAKAATPLLDPPAAATPLPPLRRNRKI